MKTLIVLSILVLTALHGLTQNSDSTKIANKDLIRVKIAAEKGKVCAEENETLRYQMDLFREQLQNRNSVIALYRQDSASLATIAEAKGFQLRASELQLNAYKDKSAALEKMVKSRGVLIRGLGVVVFLLGALVLMK